MKSAKRRPLRLYLILAITVVGFIFITLQLKRPEITNPPVTADLQAPADVKAIIRRACYDCHSNETNLRWFDNIAPVSWQVADHVKKGRELLNFSEWDKLSLADQQAKLWECINQINAGAMPIKDYEMVHTSAKVSDEDLHVLTNYLTRIRETAPIDTTLVAARDKQYAVLKEKAGFVQTPLPKALNGIEFIPDYKNWQPISSTERFDNGTLRVIFGNPIAIAAIENHQIDPWPTGTIFAKVAWDQVADEQGNITTGAFKQVEFMIKDKERFSATEGWGFARFKTPKLVPYGKNTMFATECVNCHRPLSDNDFVFSQPIKY
jgi:hypothetical protein